MKKVCFSLMLLCCLVFAQRSFAEEKEATDTSATEAKDSVTEAVAPVVEPKKEDAAPVVPPTEEKGFHQIIKEKIVEGGTGFMSIVLICLILGLAIAIERVISLNLTGTNIDDLLQKVKSTLSTSGVKEAKDLCARTKGPVASIFAQGLLRMDEGIDNVERSIESHGAAELTKLEKGMTWIQLFIQLAPMFGFMGTVIGMIQAFDKIEAMGDIEIGDVAGGIKVALLTTVAGLIVAVILQVFYNYLSSKIESITSKMEDASNDFVDMLVVSGKLKKN